jgi:hypothetical protein
LVLSQLVFFKISAPPLPFAALGGSTVTNIGPTILNGSVGVFPGTSLTGFPAEPPGVIRAHDAVAQNAQADALNAYTVLGGLSPTVLTGDFGGTTLVPGVYRLYPRPSMNVFMSISSKVAPTEFVWFIFAICFLFLF